MKKWKVALSLLLVLTFIMSTPGLAAKSSSIGVKMDGKKYSVKEIPIFLDGQPLYTDIPTFINPTNDYTYVSIRFVSEYYGAEVKWDQKTKTATVIQEGKEVKMTVNSRDLYVDGAKIVLPVGVAPKTVIFSNNDARTMVPVRFISEAFGYEVGWDERNKMPFINTAVKDNPDNNNSNNQSNTNSGEITNISIDKGSTNTPKLMISGTKPLSYSTDLLENPKRLVIDIKDAKLNIKENVQFSNGIGTINVNSNPISKVNISQFSSKPDVVRVVVDLTENMDFDIVPKNGGKTLSLAFVNRIGKIETELVDGKEALVVHNANKSKTNIIKLHNPERIVVDLLDSSIEKDNSYNYNIGFIKGVRVAQFEPDNLYKPNDRIVRVVLDIVDGISNPDVKIDTYEDKLLIVPQNNIMETINYSLKGDNRTVSINANSITDYDIDYNSDKKTMTVNIPSKNIDIEEGYIKIEDGLINDITVKGAGHYTQIIINFRRSVDYNVLSDHKDDKIVLNFKRDGNAKPSDKVIVIDPGHGGTAPGTVQNGYKEKDVNLAISLELNESLKNKGYTTIMTRDNDQTLGLYDRANIANNVQADLFISIHGNSNGDANIAGIQVLYYPYDKPNVEKAESLALARIMMDEITKGTKAQDRGLLSSPNIVVVREASMPAILIETGFLSNPGEAKLLNDKAYQELMVKSIINGIEEYFEQYH